MALFLRRPSTAGDFHSPDFHRAGSLYRPRSTSRRLSNPETGSLQSQTLLAARSDSEESEFVSKHGDVTVDIDGHLVPKHRAETEDLESDEEDDEPKTCVEKLSYYYDRFGLKHVAPVILLVLYTVIGAAIFLAIEQKQDLRDVENHNKTIDDHINKGAKTTAVLEFLHDEITKLAEDQNCLKTKLMWTYKNALFYVFTLYTTIGYGNVYTKTNHGKAATILYCLFGIPLMLAILGDLGSLLGIWLTRGWRVFTAFLKRITKKAKPKNLHEKKLFSKLIRVENGETGHYIAQEVDGETENLESDLGDPEEDSMPASAALTFAFLWLMLCSVLFILFEKSFTFFDAFYFLFISLTTVGLGDMIPQDPQYLIGNFWALIVGLIILAMCISVIQQRIEQFFYRILMMIQEEYQKMLEKDGTLTEKDRKRIMKKIWKKQPLWARTVMPNVMGNRKQEQIEHRVEQVIQRGLGTSVKKCQTDDSLFFRGRSPSIKFDQFSERIPSPESEMSLTAYDNCDPNLLSLPMSPDMEVIVTPPPSFMNEDLQSSELLLPTLVIDPPDCDHMGCQTDVPLTIDQQVMVQKHFFQDPVKETQTQRDEFQYNEIEEECQTDISSVHAELAIVPKRRSSGVGDNHIFETPNLSIGPPVQNDTQTQTTSMTLSQDSTQTDDEVIAMFDVYHQAGAPLNQLVSTEVQVTAAESSSNDEEPKTKRTTETQTMPLMFSSNSADDLTDVFFDSSSESYSASGAQSPESGSLPIIMEEDEDNDANLDEIWIEDQLASQEELLAIGEKGDSFEVPPWFDFDRTRRGTLSQENLPLPNIQTGSCTDSGVEAMGDGVSPKTENAQKHDIDVVNAMTQTLVVEVINRTIQTARVSDHKPKKSNQGLSRLFSKRYSGGDIDKSWIDQAVQVEPDFFIGLVDRYSVEVQTIDSYLKLARGLERLSRNRAQSLKIMAAPLVRARLARLKQRSGLQNP